MRDSCKFLLSTLAVVLVSCAGSQRADNETSQLSSVPSVRGSLVHVRSVVPDIVLDIRYATGQNVTGHPLYPPGMPCLLNQHTADKLRLAQQTLRSHGLGLKVWDAWRPPEVQETLFKAAGHTGMFVDPQEAWSKHCAGIAVDVTLVDASGRDVVMPSDFDQIGPVYRGVDSSVKRNATMLREAMIQAGFEGIELEWWHFDDADYHDQAPLPVATARGLGIVLPQTRR